MVSDNEMVDRILSSAASAFGVSIEDIKSKSRIRETSDARKAIVHILTRDLKKSPGHIAKILNKSHCTMNYMLQQAEFLIKNDSGFKTRRNRIRADAGLDSNLCPCCGRPYDKA